MGSYFDKIPYNINQIIEIFSNSIFLSMKIELEKNPYDLINVVWDLILIRSHKTSIKS